MNPSDHPIIEKIRAIARAKGWAIGVHGTLERDIDLIAVPWTAEATDWYEMYFAIRHGLDLDAGRIEQKPCGRVGAILIEKGAKRIEGTENFTPPQIDLSMVDGRADWP